MIAKIKEIINKLNDKGIPLPLVRNHGVGSVSLTVFILSTITMILSLFKVGNLNAWESLAWFVTCAALYHNKRVKFTKDEFSIGEEKAANSPEVKE